MAADQPGRVCQQCGTALPPDAPQGLCPACLLERACSESGGGSQRLDSPEESPTLSDGNIAIEAIGGMIGRYKLLEQIGEGGFGLVYMAEQLEPVKRLVALKIIKAGMDTREIIARFEAERQALALMDHPSIAQVFDGGVMTAGRPYFVMELVRGVPITAYCDQRNLSTTDRLSLFIEVCKAVQHAHQKGIIHRDLKPSNILVTHQDSEPQPKVIDFGVAKALGQKLTERTFFTGFLRMVGTPAYMSPEQAEMTGMDIDTRSDIYALGVLLYELLTGVTPFDAETIRNAALDEVRRMIRETEPPKPSTRLQALGEKLAEVARCRHTEPPKLIRLVHGDLDWIVMKCLEKDRRRRYETANGLAMDVQRHLKHEPVVARPPTTVYRLKKFVRRRKLVVAAGGAIAVSLVVGLTISSVSLLREKVARQRAQLAEQKQMQLRQEADRSRTDAEAARKQETEARLRAEQQALMTRRLLYATDMNQAQLALKAGNLRRAVSLLDRHSPKPGEMDLRHWEWRYLWQLSRSDEQYTLGSHSNAITSVVISSDGNRLVSGGWDTAPQVWDLPGRKAITNLSLEGSVHGLDLSPDGNLVVIGVEYSVQLWNLETFQALTNLSLPGWARAVRFSPNGRQITALCADGQVLFWDREGRRESAAFRVIPSADFIHRSLAYSPDGRWLAAGEANGRIRLVDPGTGESHFQWQAHSNTVDVIAFAPDGQTLASGGADATVRLWRVPTGEFILILTNHTEWISAVAFTPDGRTLASASADQSIRLWNALNGEELARFQGHPEEVWSLVFTPDGEQLVSSGKEGAIKVWSATARPKRYRGETIGRDLGWFSFLEDSTNLLTWTRAQKSWFVEAGGSPFAFSPGQSHLSFAGGEGNKRLLLLGIDGGDHLLTLGEHREHIERIVISPDGRTVAAAGGDGVRLWDVSSVREIATLQGAHRIVRIHNLAFSPDGQRLVTAGQGSIQLWDVTTIQEILTLEVPGSHDELAWFELVQFSRDGQALAALLNNGKVHLWRVPTLEQIAKAESSNDTARWAHPGAVELAPMGQRLGTLKEAQEIQREKLELMQRLTETEHPELVPFLNNVGLVLDGHGRYADSEALLRKAIKLCQKHWGNEDKIMAKLLESLGWTLSLQGKTEEVEDLLRRALALRKKPLGEEHPEVADTLYSLAQALHQERKHAEAELFFRKSLRMRQKLLGQEHPDVAQTLHNLGHTLEAQGKLPEAEDLLRQSLALRKNLLGDQHPDVADWVRCLREVLRQQDKLTEAETVTFEQLAIERKRLDGNDPALAAVLADAARLLLVRQKFTEAEPLARECLAIREAKLPDAWQTFNARSVLGGCLLGQKKYAEAEPLLLSGYEGMKQREEKIPTPAKPRLEEALHRLVQLYEETGQPHQAAEWKQRLAALEKPEAEQKRAGPQP